MNAAHLHLIVNHISIFATLFGIFILVWGMYKNNSSIRRIAFTLFIVAAAGSFLAVQTGDSAEDIVEELSMVSGETIHDHEEAAELSLWFSVVLGLLSIGALASKKLDLRFENGLHIAILLTAIVTSGVLTYVAYKGGEIRHPEAYTEQYETSTDIDYDD